MRVLITTSTLPNHEDDGIPRFVLDLAMALTKHAEVSVLAPDAPERPVEGTPNEIACGAVQVKRFSYFWPRSMQRLAITNQRGMRDNVRGSLLAKLQVPLFFLRQAAALKRLVQTKHVDVVNAHWLVPQGWVAAWTLRRVPHVRLVLHVHAGDVYLLQRVAIGARIARTVVKRADVIFADGSHVRDALDDLLGFSSQAILQPMGVDRKRFTQGGAAEHRQLSSYPDGFILFVGRLVEKKGVIYLIQSLGELRKQGLDVGLMIAGYGPDEEQLRSEVQRLDLVASVQFLGNQTHREIVGLLHACRVAAVPSIIDSRGETEGMPTVVVEAMAAGVPVVGSRVDGIPDVIRHTQNGWLCRPKDPQDLAAKLRLALDAGRNEVAAAGRETAKNHDWQQVARNYVEAIRQAPGLQEGSAN
ncbi:MAG: glycosyltransferase [Planctomycetota bacterium]